MKSKSQKFWLVFHSRAEENVSVEQKHARLFEGLKELPTPWGLGDRPLPPVPKSTGATAVLGLTKFYGHGVQRAMLSYRFRRLLSDDGLSDDLLNITFNPAKVDLQYLIFTVIPIYIKAFDAYLVELFDDAMIELAHQELKRLTANPRSIVHRVGVVSFFDDLLCRRAFHLSPAEVVERLQEKVEYAQTLHGGAYLVGSSHVLPLHEAQKLCLTMKSALV